MKFLVLGLCLLASASARPDVSGSYLPSVGGSGISSSFVSQPSGSYIPADGGFVNGYHGGIGGGGIIGGGVGGGVGGLVQDQRHVFFYAAPDDEAPARFRVNIAPSSARNTKIIFVKAPSYGGVIPEVIAPPSQAVDKTLVYVLVKKPQHGGAITIPSSLGVKQAKPEVFFIKYRNQHEAEQAVASGLSGQAVGSGLSDLGQGAFVRTLETGHGGIGGIGGIGGGGVFLDGAGGHGGISGGSTLVGSSVGGGVDIKYGTPGASGPYKR